MIVEFEFPPPFNWQAMMNGIMTKDDGIDDGLNDDEQWWDMMDCMMMVKMMDWMMMTITSDDGLNDDDGKKWR